MDPPILELAVQLVSEPFDAAHNTIADVRACATCFFELKRQGVI